MKKRVLSVILSFAMVFTMVPTTAFATETTVDEVVKQTTEIGGTINVGTSLHGAVATTTHKGAWAEGNGYGIAKLNDGKKNTFFISGGATVDTPITATVSFKEISYISKVVLMPSVDGTRGVEGFPVSFEIQAHTANGWETIETVTNCTDAVNSTGITADGMEFQFAPIVADAVQLVTIENAYEQNNTTNYGLRMAELEVYGILGENVGAASNGTTPSTSHKDTWGDNHGYGVATLNDGKSSSFFMSSSAAQLDPITVTLTFPSKSYVGEVVLKPSVDVVSSRGVEGFPVSFKIEAHTANGWETVKTIENCTDAVNSTGITAEGMTVSFAPVGADAVRMVTIENAFAENDKSTYGLRLAEFEVYGLNYPNVGLASNGTTPSTSQSSTFGENNGLGIAKVNDGKTSFFMSNQSSAWKNQPIEVTLAFSSTNYINEIVLKPSVDGTRGTEGLPVSFAIQARTENGWETVKTVTNCTDATNSNLTKDGIGFTFDTVIADAVRIVTSENALAENTGTSYGVRLSEFEAYGVGAENFGLASNGTVPTSSHPAKWIINGGLEATYGIQVLNDGLKKFFLSETVEQYTPVTLSLAFADTYKISKVVLKPSVDGGRGVEGFPISFAIQVLTANGWETVKTVTNCTDNINSTGISSEGMALSFYPTDAVAVRLVTSENAYGQNDKDTEYGVRMAEFEVYGMESEISLPTLPTEEYTSVQTNGTAFASTSFTYAAGGVELAKVNDGVPSGGYYTSEFFGNANGGEYVGVVFDTAHWFDSVNLSWTASRVAGMIHIEVFNGVQWLEVYRGAGVNGTIAFDAICGSAIKITADEMAIGDTTKLTYAFQLNEMGINGYDTGIVMAQPTINNITAVAVGDMTVDASSITDIAEKWGFGQDFNNVIDETKGMYSSKWVTSADNREWVEIRFASAMKLQYVKFSRWSNYTYFPKDFKIEAYTGAGWKTLVDMQDYENACNLFSFTETECSAIRLVATELAYIEHESATKSQYGLVISNMKLYGEAVDKTVALPAVLPTRSDVSGNAVMLKDLNVSETADSATDVRRLQFVFEKAMYVDRICFNSATAGLYPADYTIKAFDGKEWKVVREITGYSAGEASAHEFSFEAVYCSAIIVEVSGLYQIDDKFGYEFSSVTINGAEMAGKVAVLGDGTGDGLLTADDMVYFREKLVGTAENKQTIDIYTDGKESVLDIVRMKRYLSAK